MQEFAINVINALKKQKVNYLIIGGFAGILHGTKLETIDLDVLIENTSSNIIKFQKIINSKKLISKFERNEIIRVVGKPYSIDFHPKIDGVSTQLAMKNSVRMMIKNVEIDIISVSDLEANLLTTKKLINRRRNA